VTHAQEAGTRQKLVSETFTSLLHQKFDASFWDTEAHASPKFGPVRHAMEWLLLL